MTLIDTHVHLYADEFEKDLPNLMEAAQSSGVSKFFLPNIDSGSLAGMEAICQRWKGVCYPMYGLHPCSVKENYHEELMIVNNWLRQRKFAAIGEVGLDFFWDKSFIDEQYQSFQQQIEWALSYNLPVVIHTRNAMQETIDAVRPFATKGLKGIFHCFGGSFDEAIEIIDMNFLLGIGGVLTYKKSGLQAVMEKIDLKHIVLETDAPYLTPVPFRGKRNESAYIKIIAQKLAEIKNVSLEEVAAVTTANAEKIFGN